MLLQSFRSLQPRMQIKGELRGTLHSTAVFDPATRLALYRLAWRGPKSVGSGGLIHDGGMRCPGCCAPSIISTHAASRTQYRPSTVTTVRHVTIVLPLPNRHVLLDVFTDNGMQDGYMLPTRPGCTAYDRTLPWKREESRGRLHWPVGQDFAGIMQMCSEASNLGNDEWLEATGEDCGYWRRHSFPRVIQIMLACITWRANWQSVTRAMRRIRTVCRKGTRVLQPASATRLKMGDLWRRQARTALEICSSLG